MSEEKSANEARQGREGRRAFTILHLSLAAAALGLGVMVLAAAFWGARAPEADRPSASETIGGPANAPPP